MTTRVFVVPVLEQPLPYPGGVLPIEGDWIDPAERFWRRRLADQDIRAAEPPAAEEQPAVAAGLSAPAEPAAPSKSKK